MRFTYAEAMTDFRYYIPLAQAAEAAGYNVVTQEIDPSHRLGVFQVRLED